MAPKTSKTAKAKPAAVKKSPKRAPKPKPKGKAQNGKGTDDSIPQLPPEQVHKYTNQWQALGFIKPRDSDSKEKDADIKHNETDADGTTRDGADVAASINSSLSFFILLCKKI